MRVLSILYGILLIIAGFVFIKHPFFSIVILGCIIGVMLMVGGVNSLIGAVREHKSFWDIALGILSIIGGLFILFSYVGSILAVNVVVIILAVVVLLSGITRIMMSLEIKGAGVSGWGFMMASGILSILLAIVMFSNPFTGMFMIEIVIAATVLMQGINHITMAIAG